MNINELISILEDQRDVYGDELEVRIAQQPAWPLAADIVNAWNPADDGGVNPDDGLEPDPVLWLAVNETPGPDGRPYASKRAWGYED